MKDNRISSEKHTLERMIGLYCRLNHANKMCVDCQEVLDYGLYRLECCRYGNGKPACSKCHTHCYKPVMRERIRKIMRFSGPRMIIYYPVDFIKHIFHR